MSFLLGSQHRGSSGNVNVPAMKKESRSQSEKLMVVTSEVTSLPSTETGVADDQDDRMMEGYLWLRIHVRKRRYCVLRGRTLHVYSTKEEAMTRQAQLSPSVKKKIIVVGVKDAMELDKSVCSTLLGSASTNKQTLENALVISTQKSKLVAVEAETQTEKQRWLHAMSCLNFASASSEKSLFMSMLQDTTAFDAHAAVTMLHRYRDNPVAVDLVLDRLAEYAEHHIDDVEFYIQQIMHLVVNLEMTKTDKLVHLLLSICKARAYVEHLGNCIHLALQLFWLLEAKIQDKDPKTYNLCAKLLMSIEAKIVNQQFEVGAASASPDAVSKLLLEIPGMQERLAEMKKSINGDAQDKDSTTRPEEVTSPRSAQDTSHHSGEGLMDDAKLQRDLLMQWMEKERQKRYKYFHEQRDFIKDLCDISEKMRLIEPPSERKKHLPAALEALKIPSMAYIPLGRVSDPYCRIIRVLTTEGTVFSTHSRAPCLLCFEVIEDQVNAAGHRGSIVTKPPLRPSLLHSMGSSNRLGSKRGSTMSVGSSVASIVDEEVEVAAFIKKFAINGKYISVSDHVAIGDDDNDDDGSDDELDGTTQSGTKGEDDVPFISVLEKHFGITVLPPPTDLSSSSSQLIQAQSTPSSTSTTESVGTSESSKDASSPVDDVIRRRSKAAYDFSLAKLMAEGGVFGESWKDKKERIRSASPHGHLPGWNLISLISKSNDDIRQEVFAMQLITKFADIFRESGLPLWLRPYRIVSTGKTSGLIETITDAQSLDALKKKPGYQSLRVHFERTYGNGDINSRAFKTAQRNFLHSLVAYSLVCYLLQIKDRHNGNILLDTDGHLVHIDFGFMLGIAPGGNWSIETAPYKLTKEMVQVLGGVESKLFGEFVQLFALGMLAAQRNAERIITLVEIMMRNSTFPCFQGRDVSKDLQKLRDRFLLHCSTEQVVKTVMKLVDTSYKNKWTKRYDQFQKITNGIVP